jgi:hypothetical protein
MTPEEAHNALTAASEFMMMVRDGRNFSQNKAAAEFYGRLFPVDSPPN